MKRHSTPIDDGDITENGMNGPILKRRSIRRRNSLFYDEKDYLNLDGFGNMLKQDASDGTITDLSDDDLNPFTGSGEALAVKDQALSFSTNFDINRYSYNVGDRRASIAFAELTVEELDNASTATTFCPTENLSESYTREQLSPNPRTIDPPLFFSGNLAGCNSMLEKNLLVAIQKSEVTRVVVTKIKESMIRKWTGQ